MCGVEQCKACNFPNLLSEANQWSILPLEEESTIHHSTDNQVPNIRPELSR
jgi:hypothetical protein